MKRLIAVILLCACIASLPGCRGKGTYPIKTDESLTYWIDLSSMVRSIAPSMQVTEFSKYLEKQTGVKVEYIHPPGNRIGEYFDVMISSNNLPDIIECNWSKVPGGATKQLHDGKIIDLAPLLDQWAPDYKKLLDDDDNYRRSVLTDRGECLYFTGGYAEDYQTVYIGPFFRKDWLDDLGLKEPETLDDWEMTLQAFKEKKGAQAPLSINPNMFEVNALVGTFGVSWSFYQEDGTVKYGPFEPGFHEFVQRMASWFEQGLIDPLYPMINEEKQQVNLFAGKTGAGFGYLGADLGTWQKKINAEQLPMELVGVRNPSLHKGEKAKIAPRDPKVTNTYAAAISTNCKNPQIAASFLNYAYTKEGTMLYNFGVENVSYTMKDGIPTYMSVITDNPDMSMGSALAMYTRTSYGGPFVKDAQYTLQYCREPLQKDALDKWGDNDAAQYLLPSMEMPYEDVERFSAKMEELGKYQEEMIIKFIIGEIDLGAYDAFLQELHNGYGADDIIQMLQKNYNAYLEK